MLVGPRVTGEGRFGESIFPTADHHMKPFLLPSTSAVKKLSTYRSWGALKGLYSTVCCH